MDKTNEKVYGNSPIAVPTSTIIAYRAEDPFKVCVLEPVAKHGGRLVLPGGRLELHKWQSFEECALREWKEEVGKDAKLVDMRLWGIRTDPYVDVREVTFGRLTHDQCADDYKDIPVTGFYGQDYFFEAIVEGEPAPNDGEAKRCFFTDVRDIVITPTPEESKFGAQHDLVLYLYMECLLLKYTDRSLAFSVERLCDMRKLREHFIRHPVPADLIRGD